MSTTNRRLVVDGLTMPTMDRKWFEEWREARLGCVNMTVSVWENAPETLNLLSRWREVIRAGNPQLLVAIVERQSGHAAGMHRLIQDLGLVDRVVWWVKWQFVDHD